MAEYHVGCGIAGIYAGIIKPNGYEWKTKSNVTNEAIAAVAVYMGGKIDPGKTSVSYNVMQNGINIFRITVERESSNEKTGSNEIIYHY